MPDIKREIVPLAEWPEALKTGEPCVITEEPACTLLRVVLRPNGQITCDGDEFVATATEADHERLAVAFVELLGDLDIEPRVLHVFAGNETPVTLFAFIQADEPRVRVADCHIGNEEYGRWLHDSEMVEVCAALALPRVSVWYRGPWSPDLIEVAVGGVVVRPALERVDPERGRVAVRVPLVSKEAV
jgi:hypothetical protein